MTEATFLLTIARVDGPVYDGEVTSVTLPGIDGEMTVLAYHEPFITPLKAGDITIRTSDGVESITTESGVFEMSNNHASILL